MIRAFFIFPIPILQVLVNLLFPKNYCDLKTLIHILYHSPFHIILKAVTRSPRRNEAITLLVVASFTLSVTNIICCPILLLVFYLPLAGWPVLWLLSSPVQPRSRVLCLFHLYSRLLIANYCPVLRK